MSNVFAGIVRLAADAELKYIPSGAAVLSFSAASSTGFGDKQKTMWLRVTYWRNPEKLQPFLLKGQAVMVSGELSENEYQANDGTTKKSLELNANIIDLVGKKSEGGQNQNSQPQAPAPKPQSQDNFEDFNDDIPF